MCKELKISYLNVQPTKKFSELSSVFADLPVHTLNNKSWPEFKTKCNTTFGIFHTNNTIVMKFIVSNDYFNSFRRPINGAVHKDNCVEFFIAFSDAGYYNIEFNCLGIGKIAYGPKRLKRQLLLNTSVKKIKVISKIGNLYQDFNWEMILSIPLEVFEFDKPTSLSKMVYRGNFYKCGDELPEPHFLSWNIIDNPVPNFHLPQFFGNLIFE